MNIKIISDSTCDLSQEILTKYNISLVPLTVVKDDQDYKDNVTITPADIFSHVAAGGKLCSTSANSVGEYMDEFQRYSQQNEYVLHISLGSGFSSCYQNACLAAQEFDNVYVADSQNLSTGQGLVVLEACRLAPECATGEELVEKLNAFTGRVEASFLLDRLDYMVKGGRCSATAALGANLLNLKPCIEVKGGKMSVVKKYRGNYAKCLANYVHERLENREDIERDILFITHTPVNEDCMDAVLAAVEQCPKFDTVYNTDAGCTVSCHCGPGTLGVLFVRKA